MVLVLDSMWSYGYADAVRVGRAIEALDYFWYEDPLVEADLYNYVKLRNKLDIPIMSTEYAPGRLYGMAQWFQHIATDILRGMDDKGLVYAPEKPGRGYEIDWELVRRETVQVVK